MRSAMAAGQPSQDGQSPLDQEQGQRGPTEGEQTPDSPGEKPGGDRPNQPQPSGAKPDDRGQNPPSGTNRPSAAREDPSGAPVGAGNDAERWGTLPERVRHVFQNQITDDLPLQYRDWIDSYYRRLNRAR
jgi:hypothetical protein